MYPQHFLVAVLSSLTALPARKHFFRHRTDSSGPMTGSRLTASVMGPEAGKGGGPRHLRVDGECLALPYPGLGPRPGYLAQPGDRRALGQRNRHIARGPGAGGWRGRLIRIQRREARTQGNSERDKRVNAKETNLRLKFIPCKMATLCI